jgi:hypothetical protein
MSPERRIDNTALSVDTHFGTGSRDYRAAVVSCNHPLNPVRLLRRQGAGRFQRVSADSADQPRQVFSALDLGEFFPGSIEALADAQTLRLIAVFGVVEETLEIL